MMCFCCFVDNAEAQKKSKQSKQERRVGPAIPDMLNSRTMPDERPKPVQQPDLFAKVRVVDFDGKTGIDVSHYQGRVNWAEVARDKQVTFVILKATEGNSFVDETYQYNIRECKRHNIPVGSYHFYRANVDPEAQYQNMMRNINPSMQDILPVIDVELTNGVSPELFINRLEALCEMVTKAYGARPIIYTGRNFFAKYFNTPRFRHYKFWIAAYTTSQPELAGGQDYIFWQFTDKSRVSGIRGGVDMSRFVFGHTIEDIKYHKRR